LVRSVIGCQWPWQVQFMWLMTILDPNLSAVYIKSCQYSMFYTNKTGFSSGHEELFFLRLSELNFFVYIKSCQYSMLYTNKMFWTRSQV
jgi:predicted nucleic-acid-binding Zn-ribbon protein